jgi:hypothetical protein
MMEINATAITRVNRLTISYILLSLGKNDFDRFKKNSAISSDYPQKRLRVQAVPLLVFEFRT